MSYSNISSLRIFAIALVLLGLSACAIVPQVSGINSEANQEGCQDGEISSQIINGRLVTAREEISKEAVLLLIDKKSSQKSCTGTPVAPRVILTAAHCVSGAAANGVIAIFHTNTKCDEGFSREKSIRSSQYVIHQGFDGSPQSKSDLALVLLSKPIPGDYMIASLYDGKAKVSSQEVELLGYGITDENRHDSRRLRTTTKNFKKDLYFKEQLIMFNQASSSGGFCRGDSGAPVYVKVGGVKKIIGVNSFNIGTELNRECHTASAAMYVPYFANWIMRSILDFKVVE